MAMARHATAIGVGLIALAIYITGLAPELSPRGDLGRDLIFQGTDPVWLQRTLATWGGPDSASLAGLLTRAWSLLPSAWSLNLLSAALSAAAAAMLTRLIARAAHPVIAGAMGVAFACSPAVWAHAVAAEGDVSVLLVSLLVIAAVASVVAAPTRRDGDIHAVCALAAAAAIDLTLSLVLVTTLVVLARLGRATRAVVIASAAGLVIAVLSQGLALRALVGTVSEAADT